MVDTFGRVARNPEVSKIAAYVSVRDEKVGSNARGFLKRISSAPCPKEP